MIKKITQSLFQQKQTKDFFVYGFGQVINVLTPLLITPYLINTCGIENLGIIAIGQAFAYILIVVVDYSSYIIGVKDVSLNRDRPLELQNIFITTYIAKLFLLIIVTLLTFLLTFYIPYFNKNYIVFYFSLTIIIAQFVNPTWFFQGVENFLGITLINILSKIINVLGVILFITSKEDYIYANLFLGIGGVLANILGVAWIVKRYKFVFKTISFLSVKILLKTDFLFCVSQLFFSFRNYSSIIIIGFFAGDYVAGQFKVVEQIINFFRTYLQMFFKFSYSYICLEIKNNLKKGIEIWSKYHIKNSVFLILLLSIVYLFSEPILIFFKVEKNMLNEYNNYLNIAIFIPLLVGTTLALEQILFGLNKNDIYIKTTIFITVFNVIALSLIMTFYGLKEAFFLLMFTELMLIFIYLLILKPYFSTTYLNNIDRL
jgi:O-antigen/teichoic acid export membrane protein